MTLAIIFLAMIAGYCVGYSRGWTDAVNKMQKIKVRK